MAASYSRKCLVSRQLLYFEEIKGFSFIYGNDILKNLKGWPSFTKGYAEYVYIFCFDRIFFVIERNIYNYFRTNLQLCKVVSGRKKDFVVPKFQWGYYFLNKMLVQVCAQSPSQRSEFFGAILIIWCMSANHNTGTNQTFLFYRSDIFLDKLLWGGKMRWKRNFKNWYIA